MESVPQRQCSRCKVSFPATPEYFYRATTQGLKYGLSARCKACHSAENYRWRQERLEAQREQQRRSYYVRREAIYQRGWANILALKTQSIARQKGEESTITRKWVEERYELQAGLCYWTGVPLLITGEPKHPQKVSIDRVDSDKGYTTDNAVLCCMAINYCKNRTRPHEFAAFLEFVRSCRPEPTGAGYIGALRQPGAQETSDESAKPGEIPE